MKRNRIFLLLSLAFFLFLFQRSLFGINPSENNADELLARVRAHLMQRPIRIEALLKSKKKNGMVEKKVRVDMELKWGADIPAATYLIRDQLGGILEKMEVAWTNERQPLYTYYTGTNLQAASPPALTDAIQDTDISWSDLSFSFLWWSGGTYTGMEQKKGRRCSIVALPSPPDTQPYSGIRLWIEAESHVILEVDAYDQNVQLVKKIKIKNFQKMNDIWMVKNLDVYRYPSKQKTSLRVESMRVAE